jgi:hypothetical protein
MFVGYILLSAIAASDVPFSERVYKLSYTAAPQYEAKIGRREILAAPRQTYLVNITKYWVSPEKSSKNLWDYAFFWARPAEVQMQQLVARKADRISRLRDFTSLTIICRVVISTLV